MAQGSEHEKKDTTAGSRHGRSSGGKVSARPAAEGNAPWNSVTTDLAEAEKTSAVGDELSTPAFDGESDASVVRRASQAQRDNVAIVSRRADGQADQHADYGLVTVAEGQELDEAEAAAIENRPEAG